MDLDQLADDMHQKLDVSVDASTSHATRDLDRRESLAQTQTKQEMPPSIKNTSAEAAAMNSGSQNASGQSQPSTTANSPFVTQQGSAIANKSSATTTSTTTPMGKEAEPVPAARYLTHKREDTTGCQDVPVFGWFVTSPEGEKSWRYIT